MNVSILKFLHQHPLLREAATSLVCCSLILSPLSSSAAPQWWSENQVLNSNSPDDYALANIGQVKEIARKAAAAMDVKLAPLGAGFAVKNMVANWSSTTPRNDFAVVTLGQLKNVAKPFYDRLAEIGARPPGSYPWSGVPESQSDYSPANLGQVKSAFAFDLENAQTYTFDATESVLDSIVIAVVGGTGNVEHGEQRVISVTVTQKLWDNYRGSLGNVEKRNHRSAPAEGIVCGVSLLGDGVLGSTTLVTDANGQGSFGYTGGHRQTWIRIEASRNGVSKARWISLRPQWTYSYTTRWVTGSVNVPDGDLNVPFLATREATITAQWHSKEIWQNSTGVMQERNELQGGCEDALFYIQLYGGADSKVSPSLGSFDSNGSATVTMTQGRDENSIFGFSIVKDGIYFGGFDKTLSLPPTNGVAVFDHDDNGLKVVATPTHENVTVVPGYSSDVEVVVDLETWQVWRHDRGYENRALQAQALENATVRFIPKSNVTFPNVTLVSAPSHLPYTLFYEMPTNASGTASLNVVGENVENMTASTGIEVTYPNPLDPLEELKTTANLNWSMGNYPNINVDPVVPDDYAATAAAAAAAAFWATAAEHAAQSGQAAVAAAAAEAAANATSAAAADAARAAADDAARAAAAVGNGSGSGTGGFLICDVCVRQISIYLDKIDELDKKIQTLQDEIDTMLARFNELTTLIYDSDDQAANLAMLTEQDSLAILIRNRRKKQYPLLIQRISANMQINELSKCIHHDPFQN